MLFLVSGVQSPYSRFGFAIVQSIARTVYGDVQAGNFAQLEKFYEAYKQRKSDVFVAFIHAGDNRVPTLLQRTQYKVVLFSDGLAQAVGMVMARQGISFRASSRRATLAFSTMHFLSETTSSVLYPPPDATSLFLPLVRSLAWHYGIEPDGAFIANVVASLGLEGVTASTTVLEAMTKHSADYDDVNAVLQSLTDDDLAMLEVLQQSYGSRAPLDDGTTLLWPVEALLDPIKRDEAFRSPVDMTGRARRLAGGPGYHLPPGDWLVEVVVSVAENGSGNKLLVSVTDGRHTSSKIEMALAADGRYATTLSFTVEDPSRPTGIAFDMREGAIEGKFSVQSIRLRRTHRRDRLE